MVIAETISGLHAVKTAFDIAKGLKDIDDATRRNAAVIELQEKILTAQTAQSALVEKVGDLEKEVAGLKAWDADKQRYELKQLTMGFFAYIPKEGMERGEPIHALCANCYQRGVKSLLQSNGEPQIFKHAWVCHACKTSNKNGYYNLKELVTLVRAGAEPPS
jgi:hypothetical protein